METLQRYLDMIGDPGRYKVASKLDDANLTEDERTLMSSCLVSFLAELTAKEGSSDLSEQFGLIDASRLLLECKLTKSLLKRPDCVSLSAIISRVASALEMFTARVQCHGITSIRGRIEEYFLKLLMTAADLSSTLSAPFNQQVFKSILQIEGLSRDLVTYAGMCFANCSTVDVCKVIDSPEYHDWPLISRLSVLRAVSQKRASPDIFTYFISLLPPTSALEAPIVHFALQSLVVCLSHKPLHISDPDVIAMTSACIACFEHPVNMVGSQAQSLYTKLLTEDNAELVYSVISKLPVSRARNYFLLPMVDFFTCERFEVNALLTLVLKRSPVSASAANLLQALCRKFQLDLDLAIILNQLCQSGEDHDFCLSAISGCGPVHFKRLLNLSLSNLSPVQRMPLCVFARSRGLLTWQVQGLCDEQTVYITRDDIKSSFSAPEPEAALHALGVVAYTAKSTGPLSQDELDLLVDFVYTGFLTCAFAGAAVRSKMIKAIEFLFQRIRDAKLSSHLNTLTPLRKLFNFAFRLALTPGASIEASLPAVELLELLYTMFGSEGCQVRGSRSIKGCDIADNLGFYSDSCISDLVTFGLTGQWERTRSAISRLLLTLPERYFSKELVSNLEIVTLPKLAASERSADLAGTAAIAKIIHRKDGNFFSRVFNNVDRKNASTLFSHLTVLRGCLPCAVTSGTLALTLDVAVAWSQGISEDIQSLLVKNGIETGDLFTLSVAPVVDCRGHSLSEEDENFSADWKSVREALLTFSAVLELPETRLDDCMQSCMFTGVSGEAAIADRLGTILLLLLLSVKHIGAIAGLQSAITALTKYLLLKQDACELHALPKTWLSRITALISDPNTPSSLRLPPALRRSHGLGHGVAALLQAEVDLSLSRNSRIGRYACENMDAVVDALCTTAQTDKDEPSIVHALNVLMTMAKHSALATPLDSHLGRLLSLAATCMRRSSWKVRTAGNLLFVQVSRRLVGTDNESESNTKSSSVDELFSRFPAFFEEMLDLLVSKEFECAMAALLIFLKLSGLNRTDWLHASRPRLLLLLCSDLIGSKAWQVRKLAAQLLLRMFKGNEDELIAVIKSSDPQSANHVHGWLLVLNGMQNVDVSIAAVIVGGRFSACGPIQCLLRSGESVEGVQAVYAGHSQGESPQVLMHVLNDATSPDMSGLALRVFNKYCSSPDDRVSRELLVACIPSVKSIDNAAFETLVTAWLSCHFLEGLKVLLDDRFSHHPLFASVVCECANAIEDSEARALAAKFAWALPAVLRLELLLDESAEVRGQCCLGRMNIVASARELVSLLTASELGELVKKCMQTDYSDVHSEIWLLPQILASEISSRNDIEQITLVSCSSRYVSRLFALALKDDALKSGNSRLLSDELEDALFLSRLS